MTGQWNNEKEPHYEAMLLEALNEARNDARPSLSAEEAKAKMDALKAQQLTQLAAATRAA